MAISVKTSILNKGHHADLVVREKNLFRRNMYSTVDNKRLVYLLKGKEEVNIPLWYARNVLGIRKWEKKPDVGFWDLKMELRDYQKKIIPKALDSYNKQGTCVLQLFCGFGKTPTSLFLAHKLSRNTGKRTLIILPDKRLIRNGWITCINKYTTASLFVYSVDNKEPREDCRNPDKTSCDCLSCKEDKAQILLAMKTSSRDIPDHIMSSVGHLILDEAHMLCTQQSIDQILRTTPYYITTLTATFEKKNGLHKVIELISGPPEVVLVDSKKFYIIKVPTPFQPTGYKLNSQGHKDWHSVQEKFEKNEERNKMLVNMVLRNKHKKILILCYHVAHARLLVKEIESHGIKCAYLAGNVTKYDDADVLVATTMKIGEGFDEQNACDSWNGRRLELFILAVSKKNIEQEIGRVFRSENPIMIYPVDDFVNCKNHFRECSSFWNHRDRNGVIIEADHEDVDVDRLISDYEKRVK